MTRLIDADALLKDIGEEPMNWTDTQAEVQEYVDWKRTVATINSAPTIEAEPVRHGHWERHYSRPNVYADLCWYCSACGAKFGYEWTNHFKICPDCGAKMDEVKP